MTEPYEEDLLIRNVHALRLRLQQTQASLHDIETLQHQPRQHQQSVPVQHMSFHHTPAVKLQKPPSSRRALGTTSHGGQTQPWQRMQTAEQGGHHRKRESHKPIKHLSRHEVTSGRLTPDGLQPLTLEDLTPPSLETRSSSQSHSRAGQGRMLDQGQSIISPRGNGRNMSHTPPARDPNPGLYREPPTGSRHAQWHPDHSMSDTHSQDDPVKEHGSMVQNGDQHRKISGASWVGDTQDLSADIHLTSDHSAVSASVERENESLRQRLQGIREDNAKLVSENHRLQSELESINHKACQNTAKTELLSTELLHYKRRLPHLEDKLMGLQSENQAINTALRESEEKREDAEMQLSEIEGQLASHKEEVERLTEQVEQEKRARGRAEGQKEKAVKNIQEMQSKIEAFQECMKQKLKDHEEREEQLKNSLLQADKEREELTLQQADLKVQIDSLTSNIRLMEDEIEQQKKALSEAEAKNVRLRHQTAKIIQQKEAEQQDKEKVKQENTRLKELVEEQKAKLFQCQQDMLDSNIQLQALEEVAQRLQDGAAAKVKPGHDSGFSLSKATFENSIPDDKPNTRHVSGQAGMTGDLMLTDLRSQLSEREAEIEQLRHQVAALKDHSESSSASDKLRVDLQTARDKHRLAERRGQGLEEMVQKLEEERTRLTTQLIQLREQVSALELKQASADGRLSQRESLLKELQGQLLEKASDVEDLEKKLRKKTSEAKSLEKHVEDKSMEVTGHVTKVSQLEEELNQEHCRLLEMESKMKERVSDLEKTTQTLKSVKQIHSEQCAEMEKQIDVLHSQLERKNEDCQQYHQQMSGLKQELSAKTSSMDSMRQELQKSAWQSETALQSLEQAATEGTSRVKQLEHALVVCREEIRVQLQQVEDARRNHQAQLADKDKQMETLHQEILSQKEAAQMKLQQLNEMQQALEETQQMLQKSTSRVEELEDVQSTLQDQISQLEQELHREKSSRLQDLQGTEMKLQQTALHLQEQQLELEKMQEANKELKSQKKKSDKVGKELRGYVQDLQEECQTKAATIITIQTELETLRKGTQDKLQQVCDLEDQLHHSEVELKEKTQNLQKAEQELALKEDEVNRLQEDIKEHLTSKKSMESSIKDRDVEIIQLKQSLRNKEDELRFKEKELEDLDTVLKERQWELHHRAAQVTKLDMTMKEHRSDMEQRIIRLEGALKKSQYDAKRHASQVNSLDEQVQQVLEQLKEKELQVEQSEQEKQCLQQQLSSNQAKLNDLSKQLENQLYQLCEMKEEGQEHQTSMTKTREQLQQQQFELTEMRRELMLSEKERERLTTELEKAVAVSRTKEEERRELSAEVSTLRAKGNETEHQSKEEVQQLLQELNVVKEQHQKEMLALHESQDQLLQSSEDISVQHQQQMAVAAEREHQILHELDQARGQVENLKADMMAGKDIIEAANETIVIKDAEIARLEAKISGYERARLLQQGLTRSSSTREVSHGSIHSTNLSSLPPLPASIQSHRSASTVQTHVEKTSVNQPSTDRSHVPTHAPSVPSAAKNLEQLYFKHDKFEKKGSETGSDPLRSTLSDALARSQYDSVSTSLQQMLSEVNQTISRIPAPHSFTTREQHQQVGQNSSAVSHDPNLISMHSGGELTQYTMHTSAENSLCQKTDMPQVPPGDDKESISTEAESDKL